MAHTALITVARPVYAPSRLRMQVASQLFTSREFGEYEQRHRWIALQCGTVNPYAPDENM
ncbi:hypothetical protein M419DRAFT_119207 [Trichoderma reesei RUT C-30]|uniref:Uncharacterized protein n=1 Tax=Hypocrea jecorina (strain ATCC 56765 / BCRC 32924 / NRRL 11460 / Rut C-30) TaxID=1344414 RepID=A0A024S8X8_HYPJR|nr:hypothetical protein M419DRAFT_119207 [Trichoderma reesei RUT C-30]